jgi:hypothetical protein
MVIELEKTNPKRLEEETLTSIPQSSKVWILPSLIRLSV